MKAELLLTSQAHCAGPAGEAQEHMILRSIASSWRPEARSPFHQGNGFAWSSNSMYSSNGYRHLYC